MNSDFKTPGPRRSWGEALQVAAIIPFSIGFIFDLAIGASTSGPLAGLIWLTIFRNIAILFMAKHKPLVVCLLLLLANTAFLFVASLHQSMICYHNLATFCAEEDRGLRSALTTPVDGAALTFLLNLPAVLLVRASSRFKSA
jgi:hypothetical protein